MYFFVPCLLRDSENEELFSKPVLWAVLRASGPNSVAIYARVSAAMPVACTI